LFESKGEWSKAREQFEIVMSGKSLEVSTKKGKGKVSLQVSYLSTITLSLFLFRKKNSWRFADSLSLSLSLYAMFVEYGGFEK
jgi:hypothetical protein